MLQRGQRAKPGVDSVVEEEDHHALCLCAAATWTLKGAGSCKMDTHPWLFLGFNVGLVGDVDA